MVEERWPTGAVRRSSYDAMGNLTAKTDPLGHTTRYLVDALGRVVREVAPFEGSAVSVKKNYYDPAGNLIRQVDPVGRTTDRVYDRRNRLVRKVLWTDPLGQSTFYTYDPAGNLTELRDRNGISTYYAYDAMNRMI